VKKQARDKKPTESPKVKKQAYISCLFALLASCAQPTFYLAFYLLLAV
jgi:hypothetical protein